MQNVPRLRDLVIPMYARLFSNIADLGLQPPGHVLFDEGGSMEVGSIHYLQYYALRLTSLHVQ